MRYQKKLFIPQAEVQKYNELMNAKVVDYGEEDIDRYATVRKWCIPFTNGFEVDLKVCSSDYGDPLWCEAVLFQYNNQVSYTDVENDLLGVWELIAGEDTFTVEVLAGTGTKLCS